MVQLFMNALILSFVSKRDLSGLFFTKEVNPRLAKRPLIFKGRLGNRGLTSLVKEATGHRVIPRMHHNLVASHPWSPCIAVTIFK